MDAERRERIIACAAALLEVRGIARTSRRTVATAADVPVRSVTAVGADRSALLREVVAGLPFPPTSQRLREQATRSTDSPAAAILAAAREAFGAPASVWDVRELQAVVLAPFDDELAEVVRRRIEMRWAAAGAVVRQLRGEGGIDEAVDDDAATLHLIAVGAGLALLEDLVPRRADAQAWIGLVARLLESLAAIDPPGPAEAGPTTPWRIRVETPATPAATARVLRVLALMHADVASMFTHAHGDGTQLVDLIAFLPTRYQRRSVADALSTVASRVIVASGSRDDERDLVTRILDGATALVGHPEDVPRTLAELVVADSWQVEGAASGEDTSRDIMRLQWTPDHHIVLSRPGSPFVDVERSRASALLRLAEELSRAPAGPGGFGWSEHLGDGTRVWIRLARPEDDDAVASMHQRCSEASRYQRYFAPVSEWRADQLRRIAGGHRGATLVAESDDHSIVGLGNVFPDSPDGTRTAEIAVIVEDGWQGRGLGGRLLMHLVDLARRLGFAEVTALVLAGNAGMLRLLERMDLDWTRSEDLDLGSTVVRLSAPLDRPHAADRSAPPRR